MTVVPAIEVADRCLDLVGVTVDNPFGEQTNVYRVGEKMFALLNVTGEEMLTVKALPEEVAALIAQHDHIRPGYHMNKKHWITIDLGADLDSDELDELIGESRRLVLASLPKRVQGQILGNSGDSGDG